MRHDALTASDFFATCVCLGLNRAARATARRYDAALKPLGITSGQFSILSALRRDKPVPMGGLADVLGMDRTTLSRNLKPLESAALVVTQQGTEDRRIRCLVLTELGRDMLDKAEPLWSEAQAESNRRIGREAWHKMKPVIEALV